MDQNNEPPRITFENEGLQRPAQAFQASTPKIVQWVIQYSGGLVKDEKQAIYVLVGFVAVAISFSVFSVFNGGTFESPKDTEVLPAGLSPLLP